MKKADLTWGAGDRACMGRNIARCEMYKLVATLYSMFQVRSFFHFFFRRYLGARTRTAIRIKTNRFYRFNLWIHRKSGLSGRPWGRSLKVWRRRFVSGPVRVLIIYEQLNEYGMSLARLLSMAMLKHGDLACLIVSTKVYSAHHEVMIFKLRWLRR
jgi:hypothetical protein